MGGLSSAFDTLLNRFPTDMGEIAFWAVLIPIGIVVLFLGRYVLRGMVNRRVHSIERATAGLGGLEDMRKKGLITEEEYRTARKKAAERIVEDQKEETAKLTAGQVLAAIDQDPALARKLIPESSPRARAAMAGLGKKAGAAQGAAGKAAALPPNPDASEEDERWALNDALAREASEPKSSRNGEKPEAREEPILDPAEEWMARTAAGSADRRERERSQAQARVNTQKPGAANERMKDEPPKAAAAEIKRPNAAAPRASAPPAAPPPKKTSPAPPPERRESKARIKDLEGLLARGLITQEEYQRLAGFVGE